MTDTASAAPSEREQFEAHATERGYKLARGPNDSYQYRDAAVAWKAWQARAALTTAAGVVKESLTAAHALPPGEMWQLEAGYRLVQVCGLELSGQLKI